MNFSHSIFESAHRLLQVLIMSSFRLLGGGRAGWGLLLLGIAPGVMLSAAEPVQFGRDYYADPVGELFRLSRAG